MIPTQDEIEPLAERIERAYRRRYPYWNPIGTTPGAWETTATRLISAVGIDPTIPVDPELFIAAQPPVENPHDPWAELAQERPFRLYLKAVKKIVGAVAGGTPSGSPTGRKEATPRGLARPALRFGNLEDFPAHAVHPRPSRRPRRPFLPPSGGGGEPTSGLPALSSSRFPPAPRPILSNPARFGIPRAGVNCLDELQPELTRPASPISLASLRRTDQFVSRIERSGIIPEHKNTRLFPCAVIVVSSRWSIASSPASPRRAG